MRARARACRVCVRARTCVCACVLFPDLGGICSLLGGCERGSGLLRFGSCGCCCCVLDGKGLQADGRRAVFEDSGSWQWADRDRVQVRWLCLICFRLLSCGSIGGGLGDGSVGSSLVSGSQRCLPVTAQLWERANEATGK